MTEHLAHQPDEHLTRDTGEEPPEPDPIIDEGIGILDNIEIVVNVLAPVEDQTFTPDAGGQVAVALHGDITAHERRIDGDVELKVLDRAYQWLLDHAEAPIFVGPQGTVDLHLAEGKHTISLRVGRRPLQEDVRIFVKPPPRRSLLQRILDFFRRLFGRGG